MKRVMGAVLAGGRSSRMGQDKAMVTVGGRTMAQSVAEAMNSVFETTVVVGRSEPLAGLVPIPDRYPPHLGPLAGLASALEDLDAPIVLVAVDQPLIRIETLRELAEQAAAGETAVCLDEAPQVTCASYSPEIIDAARRHLDRGGSIRTLLSDVDHRPIDPAEWGRWGEDGRSWYSMDSQDSIVEAEQRFRLNLLE
jgi:molybdopterin-guanine dinucleotide biosynthesis protein A